MNKIVIHSAGGYDKLKYENHPIRNPKNDEVQIEVKYSGVNYADVCVRWGIYESAKKYVGWPITPGFEAAGVVSKVGSEVTKYKVGDEVIGVSFFNGYSSAINVPENQVFIKPQAMSFSEAACFPSVFMTAYHALFQNFILRKGSKVLVHSAAGGVGSSLVQLLKWHGCEVVGVIGRPHKKEYLQSLGCDHIIVKSEEDLWRRAREICPKGYDVILDANGVSSIGDSYKNLRSMGKLVIYGFHTMLPKEGGKINFLKLVWNFLKTPRFNPIDLTSDNKSLLAFNLSFLFDENDLLQEAMTTMLDLYEKGIIKAHHISEFEASDVASAHKSIESGMSIGKIALKW